MSSEQTKPVTPRPAATLILVRAGDEPRLLMGRRPSTMKFMPNVWVFPGGGLEAQDHDAAAEGALSPRCAALMGVKNFDGTDAEALAACALRETEEETGLRIRRRPDLLRFAFRAITPPSRGRRFDARFFVAKAEALVEGSLDDFKTADDELEALSWLTLAQASAAKSAMITGYILRRFQDMLDQDGLDALFDDPPRFEPVLFRGQEDGAQIDVLRVEDGAA